MRNLVKYIGIVVLICGLSACDKKEDVADTIPATSQSRQITLLHGRLAFTLPEGMVDKSSQLNPQTNNRYVYADDADQRTIIILETENHDENPAQLVARLEQQQRSRDPQLQVISRKSITQPTLQAWQLDTIISAHHQTLWSSIVVSSNTDKLFTLQITLPADNPQKAHQEAEAIIQTITLK